ncbi:MAG: phosphorylase, partial [Aliifodinibius sp.]|nr:phosphorylase [Fodinibius sp.]
MSNYAVGLDNLMQFYKLPQNKFEKEISGKIQREAKLKMKPYLARCSQSLKENIAFDMVEGNTITTPGFYAPQGRKGRL